MSEVVAVVADLMDRSRIKGALGERVSFVTSVGEVPGDASTVLVDLRARAALEVEIPAGQRWIGFGPHVDSELLEAAARRYEEVLPRSVFFRRLSSI